MDPLTCKTRVVVRVDELVAAQAGIRLEDGDTLAALTAAHIVAGVLRGTDYALAGIDSSAKAWLVRVGGEDHHE